jgi:tRNA modification GTPase
MFRTIVPEASAVVSAATGAGLDRLVERIGKFAETAVQGEPALVTRQRHRQMMDLASASLVGAFAMAQQFGTDGREELIAEQVRLATRALERLTGRVDVEDILDVIFRDFCIGK